jgi:AT-rich interactive domain-containing protein 2
MNTLYQETRKYDLLNFWTDVCTDKSARDLMLQFQPPSTAASGTPVVRRSSSVDDSITMDVDPSASERLASVKRRAEQDLEAPGCNDSADDEGLFARGRSVGTRELAGQRILQVATVIRNLSFEDDNVPILARNLTCLRFCLLCCSSKWSNLNQMGFDILSNVASDVRLEANSENCVTDVLLSTLTTCISTPDRFQVISSLDVLNKLCQLDANESFIEHVFSDQRAFYDQLVTYLSLHDIHLLISTLECLHSLSCLGENSCNAIVRSHGAIDAFVSLITVEAQSYGPKACILMRVVETVPGTNSQQHTAAVAAAAATTQHHPQAQQAAAAAVQAAGAQKSQALAQLGTLTPVRPQAPGSADGQQQQVVRVVQQQQLPGGGQKTLVTTSGGQVIQVQRAVQPGAMLTLPRHPVPLARPGALGGPAPGGVQHPVAPGQQLVLRQALPQQGQQAGQQPPQPGQPGSQQVQLRVSNDEANRTFCLSWLKATYEGVMGSNIQHEIMYKQYLASLHKLGKRDVISAQHYAVCVR